MVLSKKHITNNTMKQRKTISDVAARAGVSRSLVSVVLSGRKSTIRVSDATREKVLQAAREIDYRPNLIAQSLHLKKIFFACISLYRRRELGRFYPSAPKHSKRLPHSRLFSRDLSFGFPGRRSSEPPSCIGAAGRWYHCFPADEY